MVALNPSNSDQSHSPTRYRSRGDRARVRPPNLQHGWLLNKDASATELAAHGQVWELAVTLSKRRFGDDLEVVKRRHRVVPRGTRRGCRRG